MLADIAWGDVIGPLVAGVIGLIGVLCGARLADRSARKKLQLDVCAELLVTTTQLATTTARLRACLEKRSQSADAAAAKAFTDTKYFWGEEIPKAQAAAEKVRLLAPSEVADLAAALATLIATRVEPLHVKLDTGAELDADDFENWKTLPDALHRSVAELGKESRERIS